MPKVTLTQKFIDNGLMCPEGQRKIEFNDTIVERFRVDVTTTRPGKGTYYFSPTIDGKRSHIKIARTEDMSLREAREYAKSIRAEFQLGRNPYAEAKAKKKVITWSSFIQDWYLPHCRQHLRSWANLEEMNRLRVAPAFGQLPLNKITRHAVQQFHNELRESGLAPATCDHHLKFIRQALNLAVEWDLLNTNPVAKVRLFNVDNRQERVMSPQQLRKLMDQLDRDKNRTVCLVIKFLFFTGARVNEALHARHADIDRQNRVWTIQATNSKSKQRRSVPLSDAAMTVLDQLDSKGKSEWLFNSRRGGRLTTIAKVWTRIRREADLEGTLEGGLNLRLHDARHAAASAMVSSGQSLYTVQKILGHSDPSVTQRYAHLSTEALQDAANSIGRYMENALDKAGK